MSAVERVEQSDERTSTAAVGGRPLRILHVLAVSVPYLNGYTMRSKYIVETQRSQGLDPEVITSPFYPHVEASWREDEINGTHYYRVPHPLDARGGTGGTATASSLLWLCINSPQQLFNYFRNLQSRLGRWAERWARRMQKRMRTKPGASILRPFFRLARACARAAFAVTRVLLRSMAGMHKTLEEIILLRGFERKLEQVAQQVRPDVIHAHSPYRCGVPAAKVARKLGIPMVYEIRGLWEESGVANGNFSRTSMKYRFWRNQETRAMRSADAVVCICEQLKKEVVERGVPAERVFIVPNAVDTEVFQVASSDSGGTGAPVSPQLEQVRARLRPVTIGYVGSIRKLEGVDALVRAGAEIIRRGVDMSLLIVGDGVDLKSLKELAKKLGIAERVVFTGRVPHDEVTSYYDLIDIFVVSRPRLRVTEMVTPLKPLEAMAMGKALIVSDLQSLREIVHDGDTGLTYRADDVSDLAEKCIALINDKPLRERLAKRAAEWIREKRTWRMVLSNLDGAYKVAMENCAARQASAPKGAPRPGEAS